MRPMRGAAMKKKEDVHRMAEANKAFCSLRWIIAAGKAEAGARCRSSTGLKLGLWQFQVTAAGSARKD